MKKKRAKPDLAERAFADEVNDVVVLHCKRTSHGRERERE